MYVARTHALAKRPPRSAAVVAVVQSVDLDAGPQQFGVGRVADNAGDARVADAGAFARHGRGGLGPGGAAVAAAEDARGAGAGEDAAAVDVQRPDGVALEWQAARPVLRPVAADPNTGLVAHEQR